MKAAFLLGRLLAANTDGVALRGMRAPEVLAPLVAMADDPNDDAREKAAQALEIVVGDAQLREQCAGMGLASVVRDRVRAIAQEVSAGKRVQAESQDAIAVLMQLLKKLEGKPG
jgi:HEAT repeat protein